ncbi:MAG: transcriptional repressor LexA [Candidatus Eisenbacteria bacterium]|nr:transcriptional repressor LexA [Candidatus Eisenbacteria bacterium]
MRSLTKRQREILDYILDTIAQDGRFPSYREIGAHFGLTSPATVSQHLEALAAKGALKRNGRYYTPHDSLRRDLGVPIVGRVAAGSPITAVENIEDHVRWEQLGGEGRFAVRVVGDSMIDDGIWDGDLVIVEPRDNFHSGDLVVAYVGDEHEATVKRFYPQSSEIELRPANAAYEPMRFDPSQVHLAGKVTAVLRRY